MPAMKSIKVQTMRNGLILHVHTSKGPEQYLVPDDKSSAFKAFAEACGEALDSVSEPPPSSDPQPEPESTFGPNFGPTSDPEADADNMSLGEAANVFLQQNPGIGDFLGKFIGGMNEAEKKRAEGLRRREEYKRKQREGK